MKMMMATAYTMRGESMVRKQTAGIDEYGDEHVLHSKFSFVKTIPSPWCIDDNTWYPGGYEDYGCSCHKCEQNFKEEEIVMVEQDYGEQYCGSAYCSKCIPIVIQEAIDYLVEMKTRDNIAKNWTNMRDVMDGKE